MRPLPPPPAADQSYETLDVVDALVCNGWWKGFVCKVDTLKSTKLYTVVLFENPPESKKHIFTSQDLRFHLVWTDDSKWEIPNVADCEEQYDNTASSSEEVPTFTSKEKLLEQSTPPIAVSRNKKLKKSIIPETWETRNEPENRMEDTQVTSHQVAAEGEKERNFENLNQSSSVKVKSESELFNDVEMPFKKSSSHWHYVDSLEVFRFLPQKPYFSPLSGYNEARREAIALGHMMTFATLVEKASELEIYKPRSLFYGYLEALFELEMLGLDAKPVVDCIEELLSFKTRQEELYNLLKEVNRKIAECHGEKAKLEEDMSFLKEVFKVKTVALGRNLS